MRWSIIIILYMARIGWMDWWAHTYLYEVLVYERRIMDGWMSHSLIRQSFGCGWVNGWMDPHRSPSVRSTAYIHRTYIIWYLTWLAYVVYTRYYVLPGTYSSLHMLYTHFTVFNTQPEHAQYKTYRLRVRLYYSNWQTSFKREERAIGRCCCAVYAISTSAQIVIKCCSCSSYPDDIQHEWKRLCWLFTYQVLFIGM